MFELAEQIPRIRAERVLDAAQAAAYPHLKRESARSWWDTMLRQTRQVARAVKQLFTLNGKVVSPDQMRSELASRLGGGFEGR